MKSRAPAVESQKELSVPIKLSIVRNVSSAGDQYTDFVV
jgi:hypothetical protein